MSATPSADTAGNAVLQDLNPLKPRVLHVAYHVADIERSLAFYVGVLGMKEQMRLPLGNNLHEVILGFPSSPGAGVILMWNTEDKSERKLGTGYSRFVLHVSDVEAALRHLEEHGTRITTPLTAVGTFKYAMVQDPDGYVIELLHVAPR